MPDSHPRMAIAIAVAAVVAAIVAATFDLVDSPHTAALVLCARDQSHSTEQRRAD